MNPIKFRVSSFVIFFLLSVMQIYAQNQHSNDRELKIREDSLKIFSENIINANNPAERFVADSIFTRMFVRALKIPHSFTYPFDSLIQISRLYAPDSTFRIITWQVNKDQNIFRRHGAIQIKTNDGSLKLFPLLDKTHLIHAIADTITGPDFWVGAIYYKIITNKYNDISFYTLLGYDENDFRSTKKRIEIMYFVSGKPVFGKPLFSFEEDPVRRKTQCRFWIEYKKGSNARMLYDDELEMIVFDHLIPEDNEKDKLFTYIPDGDYEGFKWKNGKWVHVDKVFTFSLQDGEAPIPTPYIEDKLGPKIPPPKPAVKKKTGGK